MNQIEIERWEHELDILGVFAHIKDLEHHLAIAPDGAPSFLVLTDHITAAKFAAKRRMQSNV